MKSWVGVVAAAVAVFSACLAVPAPKVSIATLAELPMLDRTPYDAGLDGRAVDAALARAKHSGKRVLVDLGGNWCPDCLVLANFMRLKEVQTFLNAHFEIVVLDVGRFDKNLDVPARFGIQGRLEGVPSVLILNADGKLLNPGKITTLGDARRMSPQAIADCLAGWAE